MNDRPTNKAPHLAKVHARLQNVSIAMSTLNAGHRDRAERLAEQVERDNAARQAAVDAETIEDGTDGHV